MLKSIGNCVLGRVAEKKIQQQPRESSEKLKVAENAFLTICKNYQLENLTYINNTSKSDVHIPLQNQLVHCVGLQDVQKVWVEVI